ncbi:MAG TPA: single-stranded DNA-binding protein [Pyrinomonadaceae bacterium]|nr:single-stranded DNA-binding protein [Pyrinomonadaceae bacterium]
MSFNKITIVGNLGRDPELRYTPQGNAVCNFSVATNEKRRDRNGEMQDITTWFRITLWGKQAENASKYLTKGSPVYVEGRLKVEEWTDRDGKGRYTLEVNATDMQFISGGGRGEEMSGGGGMDETGFGDDSGDMPKSSVAPTDDDIPF